LTNFDDMMVTKRDDQIIPLDISKINQVVEWACNDIATVSASDIVINANIEFYDKISTQEIHDIVIESAVNLIKKNTNYQYVASKLLTSNLRKKVYDSFQPKSLYDIIKKNIKAGVYNDVILKEYSREEINFFDSHIKHEYDFKFTHAGMKQMVDKYLVQDRSTKEIYETPQIAFMLVPMYGFRNYTDKEKRKNIIIEFYESLNKHEINLPTPIIAGLRTPKEQFSSCTVITCDDNLKSISATDDAIFNYTAMRAGIGLDVGAIRPIGSKIRSGEVVHTGLIPFLKKFHATNKSCTQNGIRGGAMTVHLPWWHPEIEEFIVIKNDKGSNDARIPGIDPAIQLDGIFFERARKGKKLTLLSPNDFPNVYETFGQEGFKEAYEEAERLIKASPSDYPTSRKIDARGLLQSVARERVETGRLYVHYIDNANKYTPYKDRIRSSNLCVSGDTMIDVKIGDKYLTIHIDELTGMMDLYANILVKSKNIDTNTVEYKKITAFAMTNPKTKVLVIKDNDTGKIIKCTPDHKIYTKNRGYVIAGELTKDDILDIK
jgi:ribonucleoside-diphosphate reductase alpha chain